MDIQEFAKDFINTVKDSVETSNEDYDTILAKNILEYIEDTEEVNAPTICCFQKTRSRITAYDYNDEIESLDLFYLIKSDSALGKINNSKVQQGFNYLISFYNETMEGILLRSSKVKKNDEIEEISKFIQSTKGNIKLLRIYVITNGLTDPSAIPSPVESEDQTYTIEFNVWDMQKIYRQHNTRTGKQKIEIDFQINYNNALPCLKMCDSPYVDTYLAIMPGEILAKIYKEYHQTLLENNVRTFLQFKGKVNKSIRKTLREEPDMFFSYNNGISTTASEIKLNEKNYITNIYNWQIVNGGQTTASIAASINDKDVDLKKVFVPMKISVVKDSENREDIVKKISFTANSQTNIKNSDFLSNEQYLIDLEKFSRKEWIPNGNNTPISKWYFERTRGQYLDQLAQLSGYREKLFKIEYPKSHKITKTDLAKYEMGWIQQPFYACKGAEKNYLLFAAFIKKTKTQVTDTYFKNIVAKCILFNKIDETVRSEELGYKSFINTYILSSISYLSKKNLDLTYIWENQKVQEEVADKIVELIPIIQDHLTKITDVRRWSGKKECWDLLKSKLDNIETFSDKITQTDISENPSSLNEFQKEKIQEAESYTSDYWFELAKWAKSNNFLTLIERKSAFNFGTKHSRGQKIKTLSQAQHALKIIENAKDLGFEKK